MPRKISLDGSEYIILKCLPGQRDASKLWYAFFIERLCAHMDITMCPEQPCILKCGDKGALLLHVDDVVILGDESWISDVRTYTLVRRCTAGMLEFLKRMHVIEANYEAITVYGELKHAHA